MSLGRLVLLLRPRGASFRDSFLPLNHRVHMVNKGGVIRIAIYHRQRVYRIYQRAVSGFGGSAGFLHDAHLTGCVRFRALGDCGEEGFLFCLQVGNPNTKIQRGAFGGIQCIQVLQQIVQHPAFFGLRQLRGVAVLVNIINYCTNKYFILSL